MANLKAAAELQDAAVEVLRDNGGTLPYEEYLAALRMEGLHEAVAMLPVMKNTGRIRYKLATVAGGGRELSVTLAEGI